MLKMIQNLSFSVVIIVWKGFHFRSNTNRTGAEGLFLYHPRLLYCPNKMLAMMVLSQHQNLSSKTIRPRAPCDGHCIRLVIRMSSVVCSMALHSRFGGAVRPHLCKDEWNCSTPGCRQLSLTQTVRDKLIPTGLALILDIKTWSLDVLLQ